MINPDVGILLTNVGSPDYPTASSVRSYLKKFLSDRRIVEINRFIWWPILHGCILRIRPRRSALLYKKIWTEDGSPLHFFSEIMAEKLQHKLKTPVVIGMHYGNPSIANALEKLRKLKVKKILILPLYPQYSGTTTAVTFDQVASVLKEWRDIPEIRLTHDYAKNENYIDALYTSIKSHSINYLLFSFHGIPEHCIERGDPYQEQCYATVRLIIEKLKLPNHKWSVSFQSRLGRAKWLSPYTDKIIKELPKRGVTDLHVICPGFAVDCLETLEEINIRYRELFLKSGGKSFHYIPALNDNHHQIALLEGIILENLGGWVQPPLATLSSFQEDKQNS